MNTTFHELLEQYNCPRCGGVIPREAVRTDVDDIAGHLRRRVVAACVHCNVGWCAEFRLHAGVWLLDGQVRESTAIERRLVKSLLDRAESVVSSQ